ncbi:MAG: LytTR family transcriptional regulator [Spirosomaceae bacterium]|nr:LytTR family transcriptional regulator [Spirosomataceae bacterium]
METIKILRKKYIPPSEVIMLKADINYTELHFACGKTLILAKTLKSLQADFYPYGFFRINKTNMINLNYLHKTIDDFSHVILKNRLELNVSRRRREDLKNIIHQKKS